MTTSVVIPAYNGTKFLSANIPAVLSLKANEVIIIDDASSDPVTISGAKIIRHPHNLGFPQSVNDGFAAASGEIVILLNQDVCPHPDLLKHIMPHFLDPKICAVTFNEHARSWPKADIKDGFLEFTNGELDTKSHISFWASGGSAAFRKSTWDELGGFDPKFTPGYYEDLDYGWRAGNKGYQIIWDPKALVDHVAPESTFNNTFPSQKLQYIKDRNYLLAHWNNLDRKYYSRHLSHLMTRILHHPGYLVPTLWALWTKLV